MFFIFFCLVFLVTFLYLFIFILSFFLFFYSFMLLLMELAELSEASRWLPAERALRALPASKHSINFLTPL